MTYMYIEPTVLAKHLFFASGGQQTKSRLLGLALQSRGIQNFD